MKVLSNGPKEHPWTRKCSCKECKSSLEVEADDVAYEEWSDMGGENNHAYFVRCPICKFKVMVKDEYVPAVIQVAAKKRYRRRS